MRSKNLVFWVMTALAFGGLTGCMKSIDNQDEEKALENENAIVKYLSDTIKATKDPNGYYFLKRVANPGGDSAKIGNQASVAVKAYLLDGTTPVISDTAVFPVGANAISVFGIELAVRKMLTGEKASAFLPFYLAFGSSDRTNIPAYSAIRMEMVFLKSRTEIQQIDDFLVKKKFQVTERTPENLVIIRTDTTTGTPIGPGKSVSVKYVGKFLNDTKFDEGTYQLTTGTGSAIVGFDQAVQKLPRKGKAIVVFPSSLGYKTGTREMPGYTPLQFEIEVL